MNRFYSLLLGSILIVFSSHSYNLLPGKKVMEARSQLNDFEQKRPYIQATATFGSFVCSIPYMIKIKNNSFSGKLPFGIGLLATVAGNALANNVMDVYRNRLSVNAYDALADESYEIRQYALNQQQNNTDLRSQLLRLTMK